MSAAAVAQATDTTGTRAAEPFPGYDELCGYRLIYASTAHVALAVIEPDGSAAIVLDPQLNWVAEQARRQFLIAHECAHHRFGHTTETASAERAASHRVVRDQELSADCWAAETLSRAGQHRTVRIMTERFFRSGLYSPGSGYPSGLQRSSIIRQCAAAAGAESGVD